jgi:hypothetical protein
LFKKLCLLFAQYFIENDCGTLIKTVCRKFIARHYENVTERGLAGGWKKLLRELVCIYFGVQR